MPPMTNDEIAQWILSQLSIVPTRFSVLVESGREDGIVMRAIDRGLQRLRKRGAIDFVRPYGWRRVLK